MMKCDLCNNDAQYHQCQECMNDKLVGSHTDEQYAALENKVFKRMAELEGLEWDTFDNLKSTNAALLEALETIMEDTESLYIREIAAEAIRKAKGG